MSKFLCVCWCPCERFRDHLGLPIRVSEVFSGLCTTRFCLSENLCSLFFPRSLLEAWGLSARYSTALTCLFTLPSLHSNFWLPFQKHPLTVCNLQVFHFLLLARFEKINATSASHHSHPVILNAVKQTSGVIKKIKMPICCYLLLYYI